MGGKSRPQQWATACEEASSAVTTAIEALQSLVELQQEYSEWRDNLPENLQSSPVAEKLDGIADLDLEGAVSTMEDVQSTLEEAEGADLPQGFGRD